MPLYTDSHCIMDTDLLISLETFDGCGAHDGLYGIRALFGLGHKWREATYIYPACAERDTAFQAISTLVREEQAELLAELDSEDGEHEEEDEE